MTMSATQVCLRRVESCLEGHEAGVFGVDEGSRTHRSDVKWGRVAVSECPTFSDFMGVDNDVVGERCQRTGHTTWPTMISIMWILV